MTTQPPETAPKTVDEDDLEPLPSFSEQVSQQLGGVRGLIESSVPVLVFVILNFAGSKTHAWSLRGSLIASVALALGIAGFRLVGGKTVRHALNGVFGIALGAAIAWRSGEARDFYLPGIFIGAGYGVAMIVSAMVRRPLVGWLWAVMLDGGDTRWYRRPSLRRTFNWLTLLWAATYLAKVVLQYGLYRAHADDWLGLVRIVFGWPPYALLFALTVWSARRVIRREEELGGDPQTLDPGRPVEPRLPTT